MSSFDPYHTWLGIPPLEQPPHYYRLLGIAVFEDHLTVIEEAADRQMAHVKSHAKGKYSALSQKLLNEIAAAKVTLLNKDKKQKYDQSLKSELNEESAARSVENRDSQTDAAFPNITTDAPAPAERLKRKSERPKWLIPALAGGGLASLAALVGLGALLMGGGNSTGPGQSAQSPAGDARQTAQVDSADPAVRRNEQTTAPTDAAQSTSSQAAPTNANAGESDSRSTAAAPANSNNYRPAPAETLPVVGAAQPTELATNATGENAPVDVADKSNQNSLPADTSEDSEPAPAIDQRSLADLIAEPKKQAPPDTEALRAANETIASLFEEELEAARDAPSQSLLANKFLGEADSQSFREAPSARYALLLKARELAVAAGDGNTAWRAIDAVENGFEVEALPVRVFTLKEIARSVRSTEARQLLVEQALQASQDALASDQFEAADETATLAATMAARLRNADLRKRAAAARKLAQSLSQQHARMKQALAVLESDPDDAQANLLVGKYYCLVDGDWGKGAPLLMKSGHEQWAAAAQVDTALSESPDPPDAQSAKRAGDAWWEFAEKNRDEEEQAAIRRRGAHWYKIASAELSGIEKLSLEKKIREAGEEPGDVQPNTSTAAASGSPPVAADASVGLVKTFDGHEGEVVSCQFSPDHKSVVSASKDGTVRVWDVATEREVFSTPHHANFAAFVSPTQLFTLGYDQNVGYWDLRAKRLVDRRPYAGSWDGAEAVLCPAAPVFAYSTCWKLAIYHLGRRDELTFPKSDEPIFAVGLSADGQFALSGDKVGNVRLWSVAAGKEIKQFANLGAEVFATVLSPDNRLVLTAHRPGGIITLFDTQSGEAKRTHRLEWVDGAAFSPDGKRYAAVGRQSIAVWDTESGDQLRSFSVPDVWLRTLTFSANGDFLLTAGEENVVRLWKIGGDESTTSGQTGS